MIFIKIKGEGNEDMLVNVAQIKFIVPNQKRNDCFVDFGEGVYIRSKTSFAEFEKMLIKGATNEQAEKGR